MTITRWEPMREFLSLRDTMDRLFEDVLARSGEAVRPGSRVAPLDILEHDEEYVVHAAVPGFGPEQIEVSVQGDLLKLSGTLDAHEEQADDCYHLKEWHRASFERSVRLPAGVDASAVTADVKDGVLTVKLPKAAQTVARKIDVRS